MLQCGTWGAISTRLGGPTEESYAVTFAMEFMVGSLPPREGIQLYMARIDPHLISDCEVALDVDVVHIGWLEKIQHQFLRRLLGLNPRSALAPLFTETGLLQIKCRRLFSLGYLRYIGQLGSRHYAHSVFRDSLSLAGSHVASWIGDIRCLLSDLPTSVELRDEDAFDAKRLDELMKMSSLLGRLRYRPVLTTRRSWLTPSSIRTPAC